MNLKEVLDRTTQFLKEKKFESPRLEAELLISGALKYDKRVDLYLKFDLPLKDHELQSCRDVVRRRSLGEPIAYIFKQKEFFGFTFKVGPEVLIPRPETEHIIEQVLNWIKPDQEYKIIDLGTGSGCIGLTLAKKIPNASVIMVDASSSALKLAQENAISLAIPPEKISFVENDVEKLEYRSGSFDIVISNPPYIAESDLNVQETVKKFEPKIALFADLDGYHNLKTWSSKAAHWLKPTSFLGFEMGASQGPEMVKHFNSLGIFSTVRIVKDLAGLDRHIIGERLS